jgi:uncharacterized protein (TIGR02646 family)
MIAFSPNNLSINAANYLQALTNDVTSHPTLAAQYERAKTLWEARKNRQADQLIWVEIERKLSENHPRPGLCQYCEFDRTSPTEHFYPKKHFPHKAFSWNNYLRICTKCNSEFKGDKFAIFNPAGSSTFEELAITRGTYPAPPTEDAVLLNPRMDNPQDYLRLDLATGIFVDNYTNDRLKARAKYTRELFRFNSNDLLLRHRRKAFDHYFQKLETYAAIKSTTDFSDLLSKLPASKRLIVKEDIPFETEKSRLLNLLEADIKDDLFPTVWAEMKLQRAFFTRLNDLFEQNRETLTWV